MSSNARPCGHKRQRPSNDIDRLTNLPKSVIYHIISLLPAKDAVATSLLSTGWRSLWKNIHNLIFRDNIRRFSRRATNERNIKFAHFVNKALLLLNEQTIDKFSLTIGKYCEVYDVTTWITAAVARDLKVLAFCLNDSYPSDPLIQFPCSLFSCKTLEFLELCGAYLSVPSLVCLPNVKTLRLRYVRYQCDESVRMLISGCSSLETLFIQRDVYDNVVTFTISSPTLRNLELLFYQTNLVRRREIDYKLEINAPALTYLHLSDWLSGDFFVENLCSLEKAELWNKNVKSEANVPLIDYGHYSKAVVKLLQGVHNVKYLSLSLDILEALSHAGASPSFPRLTRLDAYAKFCHFNFLVNLVEGLHKLESLTLSVDLNHDAPHVACWSKPEKLPICLFSCLKTMLMSGFEGLEVEPFVRNNA